MQSASLLQFGKGGGGRYGLNRDVTLRNFRFLEHGFRKLAEDRKTVLEEYPPQCMLGYEIWVHKTDDDDPEVPDHVEDFLPVGQLTKSRLLELGWWDRMTEQDKKRRAGDGGYLPSADNETSSESGPFLVMEGKSDVWEGCAYAQVMTEYIALGLNEHADKFLQMGVSALNEIDVHLGEKQVAKSKKQEQQEKLTGESKNARTVVVPTEILVWPWDKNSGTAPTAKPAAAKSAGKPAAKSATTAAPAIPTPATPDAPAGGNGVDDDEKIAQYVVQALKNAPGNTLKKATLPSKLISLVAKEGTKRTPYLQRANSDEFLAGRAEFVFDPASGDIVLM